MINKADFLSISVSVKNVSKTFLTASEEKHALTDVSLEISGGSCTVIGGENGSGKSVLMSIIAGLEEADSGSVIFKGDTMTEASHAKEGFPARAAASAQESPAREPLSKGTLSKRAPSAQECSSARKLVGLVFQEAETQILGETPREDISFGPKNLGWDKERVQRAVDAALQKTGLADKADFPARFLSGGEKRRLAVACMLAMDLPIIILDEPFANLDYGGVRQVNALINQLKSEGKTVIILTHEIEKCLALADHFVVLFRGKKVFDCTPTQGLSQNLEQWNIKNPLGSYNSLQDLVWL